LALKTKIREISSKSEALEKDGRQTLWTGGGTENKSKESVGRGGKKRIRKGTNLGRSKSPTLNHASGSKEKGEGTGHKEEREAFENQKGAVVPS